MLSVTITRGVLRQETLLKGGSKKDSSNQDKSAYKLVRPGDIAYNKMRAWQGAVGASRLRGIVSPAYVVVRLRDGNDPRYFHYLFRTPSFMKEAERWSYGIASDMWSLRPEHFRMIYGCLPPLPEQVAIVRFLDYADRRIRRYLDAKQKLIRLLEEQKQAIIQRVVFRGLDDTVHLKSTGVDWWGEIPEHWSMTRVKNLLRETDLRSTSGEETLLSMRRIHGLVPHDEHFARPGQAVSTIGYKLVRPGQVVMNRLQANNGLIFESPLYGVVSPDYAVFDPIGDVCLDYLTALFRTPRMTWKFRVEAKGLGTGTSGFLRLYADAFGRIPVALPPRPEQVRIMQELEMRLKAIRQAMARADKEIELLREYHARLAADVVTGKLDVRQATSQLPDEAEETPPSEGFEEMPDLEDLDVDTEMDVEEIEA